MARTTRSSKKVVNEEKEIVDKNNGIDQVPKGKKRGKKGKSVVKKKEEEKLEPSANSSEQKDVRNSKEDDVVDEQNCNSNETNEMSENNTSGKRKRENSKEIIEDRPNKLCRKSGELDTSAVRSTPASGRWWKPINKERFSMVQYRAQSSTLSTSWERKMALRKQKQLRKEYEAEVKQRHAAANEEAKQKRLEKAKRKAENEMKNAKVQVISKTEKIKKMNKKQLKSVMKTQMDNDGNVHYVPLYSS